MATHYSKEDCNAGVFRRNDSISRNANKLRISQHLQEYPGFDQCWAHLYYWNISSLLCLSSTFSIHSHPLASACEYFHQWMSLVHVFKSLQHFRLEQFSTVDCYIYLRKECYITKALYYSFKAVNGTLWILFMVTNVKAK